ncbi:MAG: UDP-N-acetylglucosamine 2-epimerase (non-hydrolyzing) [Bacteroidales bacterium]|nr:UDP-N-acetylglucosamine 2-epimerase (non-hydrolyzing) [Bacteroidales bacterium]
MKILTVIGARPQIIKASALSRAIQNGYSNKIEEVIVHTGQHYDASMSGIFFSELQIPKEKYNLNTGSLSHGKQTARMIEGIEDIILSERPDALVIYGDTNSTLAGAVAASKLLIPVIHIEAGLRSFDKTMPEEINRILSDNVSTLLFTPTQTGYNNLISEGFPSEICKKPDFNHPNIYHCGDIMLDNTLYFRNIALNNTEYKKKYGDNFILCTVHRNTNTDNAEKLSNIFLSLLETAKMQKIIMPLHPRTKKMAEQLLPADLQKAIRNNPNIIITDPVGYLEMIYLESMSSFVITDSGGVQKEAYFLGKPCIILRPQTEWVEIVDAGAAIITDTDKEKIVQSAKLFSDESVRNKIRTQCLDSKLFGNGKTAEFICKTITECL